MSITKAASCIAALVGLGLVSGQALGKEPSKAELDTIRQAR
jgi:hypothetical protein